MPAVPDEPPLPTYPGDPDEESEPPLVLPEPTAVTPASEEGLKPSEDAAEEIVCRVCGNICTQDMRFCNLCGTPLRTVTPEPPENKPAEPDEPAAPAGETACPVCGNLCAPNMKYCNLCGTSLLTPPAAVEPEPPKQCRQCGAALEPGQRFCMECGTPVQ